MSKTIISYFVLIGLIIFGGYYYTIAQTYSGEAASNQDAAYFPKILAVVLIGLAIINLIQNMMNHKKDDTKIEIPNLKYVVGTIVLTALYFFSWSKFGYFYVQTFVFLVLLCSLYRIPFKGWGRNNLVIIGSTAVGLVILIYLIFEFIMPVPINF